MSDPQQATPLYLIDASIYVFRAYHSIPSSFVDVDGKPVNAVYGYANFLLEFLDRAVRNTAQTLQDLRVSVAFDQSLNTCYRNDIYPAYKANRESPDEDILHQFSACKNLTSILGFHNLSLDRYEADDIIGTLAAQFSTDEPTIILTRDKDLAQLLRQQDKLWDFAADTYMDQLATFEKFAVESYQIADFLALAGDSVDNIPGAKGVGAKTAAKLLQHFDSLDSLLARPNEIAQLDIRGAARIMEAIIAQADELTMFKQITDIHREVPLSVREVDFNLLPASEADMTEFCQKMNFGERLSQRLVNKSKQISGNLS